jgi:restriction endonuclease S subunit
VLQKNIYKLQKGAGQPHVYSKDLSQLSLPIPSIETQNTVVQTLDDLAEQKQLLTDRKSGIERQMKYYFETQIKKMVNNSEGEWKNLGDICKIKNGKSITKKDLKPGDIPVLGGGVKPLGFHNIHNIEKNTITISKDGANAGYVNIFNEPIYATGHCLYITNINNNVNYKYLFFNMKNFEKKIYSLQKGGAQPGIDKNEVMKISLPIISSDKQTKIVEYLDKLEAKKNSINDEINDIDIIMKDMLKQSYC